MQDEQICSECSQPVIRIYKVSWAHKLIHTNCKLSDGLTLVEIEKDIYQFEVIDINARRWFVDKFNELFEQQKSGSIEEKKPLNAIKEAEYTISPFNGQPKAIKKKNIGFEIYE